MLSADASYDQDELDQATALVAPTPSMVVKSEPSGDATPIVKMEAVKTEPQTRQQSRRRATPQRQPAPSRSAIKTPNKSKKSVHFSQQIKTEIKEEKLDNEEGETEAEVMIK